MRFGYTIIYVENVEATMHFYEKAFGLKHRFLDETKQYGELNTDDAILAFASEPLAESKTRTFVKNRLGNNPPGFEIAFVTDDVEEAYAKAIAAGAISVKEPVEQPWGQVDAYVQDNNGILIELCSPIE